MDADPFTQAVVLLSELLTEGKPVRVELERNGLRGEMAVSPIAETAPQPPPVDAIARGNAGLMFSPIEETILKKAVTEHWQTAGELAEKTGQKCGHWFYAILGNLADRKCLDSGRNGYRLRAQS